MMGGHLSMTSVQLYGVQILVMLKAVQRLFYCVQILVMLKSVLRQFYSVQILVMLKWNQYRDSSIAYKYLSC